MNSKYVVLDAISNNRVSINGASYCVLSQQELADMLHISKVKVNKTIAELIENRYLQLFDGKKGKYEITEKGIKALSVIKSGEVR